MVWDSLFLIDYKISQKYISYQELSQELMKHHEIKVTQILTLILVCSTSFIPL